MALTFSRRRQRKLSIPKLLALAVVAAVLLLGSNAFSATEKERNKLKDQIGRYQFENKGTGMANILDTITGQIRMCLITKETYDIYKWTCHPWSNDDRDNFGK